MVQKCYYAVHFLACHVMWQQAIAMNMLLRRCCKTFVRVWLIWPGKKVWMLCELSCWTLIVISKSCACLDHHVDALFAAISFVLFSFHTMSARIVWITKTKRESFLCTFFPSHAHAMLSVTAYSFPRGIYCTIWQCMKVETGMQSYVYFLKCLLFLTRWQLNEIQRQAFQKYFRDKHSNISQPIAV